MTPASHFAAIALLAAATGAVPQVLAQARTAARVEVILDIVASVAP